MLEAEDHRALELFFLFVSTNVHTRTGFLKDQPLTKIHVRYVDISNHLMSYSYSNGWYVKFLANMHETVWNFRTIFWNLFGPHYDRGLNTQKFHPSDNLGDDLECFKKIKALSAFLHANINIIVKQAYVYTSKPLQKRFKDTVTVFVFNLKRRNVGGFTTFRTLLSISLRRQGIVLSVEHINLDSLLTFGGMGKIIIYINIGSSVPLLIAPVLMTSQGRCNC